MKHDLESRLQDLLAERGRVGQATVDRVLASMDSLPDRHLGGRARVPVAAVAAVVVVTVVGLALVALFRDPADVATQVSPSPSTASVAPSASAAAVSPEPTASSSPTLQPRPAWTVDLASRLDCDGPPSTMGMDVPPIPGPIDPAPTPEGALDNIRLDYWTLPASGFEATLVDEHWALHRYFVDGRAKVHAVSTNQFEEVPSETRWQVVGLRACDPSEFDPADLGSKATTIWLDASGDRVRTDVVHSNVGPAHCGWQRTVFLTLDDGHAQYFRDPHHDLAAYSVVTFDADVRLPADAVDTGLHTDDWHLFTIPSGRAVFVRTTEGLVELWPRASQPVGCA